MTLKTATVMALIGTLLLSVLAAIDFFTAFSGFLVNVVPALSMLRSLVYLFACCSVTVFFFFFSDSQTW